MNVRMQIPRAALLVSLLAVPLMPGHLVGQDPQPTPVEQADARAQASSVLSPEVFAQVDAEATDLEASGIAPAILYRKALEGAAKRVPEDRLVPGVLQYAARLRTARLAFATDPAGGARIDPPLLVAGADALQRGVSPELLARLGDDGAQRTPVSVLVLADLVETGLGDERALGLVREAVQARTRDQRMLEIPAEARRLLRQGRSPTDVAEDLRRALRRRGGGGL
jgi:hypothetical protein